MRSVIGGIIFGTALAVLEYLIFFRPNHYFFEGDTIHWFYLRHQSIQGFFRSFLELDPAGWYRPLTNRTIQSLFYPVFGLEPAGYRVVHYLLFMAALLAVYKLSIAVMKRKLPACIATLFFAIHSVNAFTTFDVLFTPEVVYTFFYVGAVAAYLRYRESENRRLLIVSIALFIASLCSKEAAVTLPVMLVALDIILNRRKLLAAIGGARAHFLVLALYAAFVFGYLGVQRSAFESIFARFGPEVAYRFSFDDTVANNLDHALSWSFNIPRGWQTDSRRLQGWMVTFLKAFRVIVLAVMVWFLFRPDRRLMLAGVAWFFIAVLPALPLVDHFLPHYLFLPLVGFSIAIGTAVGALYERPGGHRPPLQFMFAILVAVNAYGARNDIRDHRVLGWSSRVAFNTMTDLKAVYPTLKSNTTIYINDAEDPNVSWDTANGALFKLAYGDDTIETLYWSWGHVITKSAVERGPVIVMKYHDFHLTDVTDAFLAASEPPVAYIPSKEHILEVHPAAATAGEKYRLSISGLPNADVRVHYTRDGGPLQAFDVHLDANHKAEFDVSDQTEQGTYKFVGFRRAGDVEWTQAAASIRID